MKKAVLISIRPQWCQKIASGEKTIEVRKNRPKLAPPFRCYIYCTAGSLDYISSNGVPVSCPDGMRVIGEFTCPCFVPIQVTENGSIVNWMYEHMEDSCVPYDEVANYVGNNHVGSGWRISDLVTYDKPRELTEFVGLRDTKFGAETVEIKRPPQSWCYVEEKTK